MSHAFCESVTASPISPWCIRELTKEGKKLTGGVDTASFCGRVRPPMGWDLNVDFKSHLTYTKTSGDAKHICPRCLKAWNAGRREYQPGSPNDNK